MRGVGRTRAVMIRRSLEEILVKLGFVTFSPPGAWAGSLSDEAEAAIKLGNDTILSMSDMIVVRFLPNVESVGTNEELALASCIGMRIVIVCGVRDDISDAIAWANPIIGGSNRKHRVQVDYAFVESGKLNTVSTILYDMVSDITG